MLKNGVVNALSSGIGLKLGDKYFSQFVPIFMLHRFDIPGVGAGLNTELHTRELLTFTLEWLRSKNFNFVSVDDIALAIKEKTPLPPRSIAFSLDDGFCDQFEVGVDVFAAYDCPATFYVSTGYINDEIWFWDSKVEYLLTEAAKTPENATRLSSLQEAFPHLQLANANIRQCFVAIVYDLMNQNYGEINSTLARLSTFLGVELPEDAPKAFAPASWNSIVDAEKRGMVIGAHTHRHPILSNESDEDALMEMRMSRDILAARLTRQSDVFCYPVGRTPDFGVREEKFANELGFVGAVSTEPYYANLQDYEKRYRIPRFGFPKTKQDIMQYATWIEAFKGRLRGGE